MPDFHLVDPQGWEFDLQSVYSAYMGYFQLHSVPWHDRTWCHYFETFEQFLAFSWPAVTVTDARTGRAHIVTRMSSVTAFLRMIKTRFGETLPQVDNMLQVTPVETSQRHLRHISDWPAYRKLHATLPAVALATFKARVRVGDPTATRELWATRDKTFLALDFECLDRNDRSCVEWGYAVIRCSHLEAAGAWPPVPDKNYRKGHYIISEYADKTAPTGSWQYAFGESQAIPKAKLPRLVQSVLSSLLSPDSEAVANDVVLIAHGVQAVLQRLDEMKIKLPHNVLVLDIAYLERALFNTGERGPMLSRKTGKSRLPESLLSLSGILHSFGIAPPCALHNAGNDAFMALVAFQRMADPRGGVGAVGTPAAATGAETATVGRAGGTGGRGGHVQRAATVAARFFRPLSGLPAAVDVGAAVNETARTQTRTGGGGRGTGGADEMGMKTAKRRASVFGALTLQSPRVAPAAIADKKKVGTSNESTSGSGSGWSILPGQRQHSTVLEKRL